MNKKITSAGIILNAEKPRVGVVSANSLVDWAWEDIDQGIDLNYEEFCLEQEEKAEKVENDASLTDEEKANALEDLEHETEFYECDSRTVLFGDAWVKGADGKYTINQSRGGFAASFSSDTNVVTVEWSEHTTQCHHTSPCYVMADGSGPCGDLDTPGDSVVAYTLPPEYFEKTEG